MKVSIEPLGTAPIDMDLKDKDATVVVEADGDNVIVLDWTMKGFGTHARVSSITIKQQERKLNDKDIGVGKHFGVSHDGRLLVEKAD